MPQKEHDPLTLMLTVRDAKKSVAFYRETLGFELEAAWPDEKNPMWANMMMGRQGIMIGALMSDADAAKMCAGDEGAAKYMRALAEEYRKNQPGVGVLIYVQVPDVDAYHAQLTTKGLKELPKPKTQFYGIREFALQDPDGFRFLFYTPVKMGSCQSCGMPMKDAKAGELYCGYCTDANGKLKPFEQILEGTTTGYFMGMQKMPRAEAEKAAREHLRKMPAWHGRA
ncbi:MAG TPA: VOC family protein [Planctomycetota bacterium]|jgi:uncharacterized glyoxalase superfamily protein PhnB|nr:VOC family protein [Planctomycetota bacterium]